MGKPVDESYQLLVARRIGKQVAALEARIPGATTGEDVECVHQARVASRRLRTVLNMAGECLGAKRARKWLKALSRLTKMLGAARDCDVAVGLLDGLLADLDEKTARAGISRLRLRVRQKREALQPAVVKALKRFDRDGVLADLHAASERIGFALKGRDPAERSDFLFRWARDHIVRRFEQLRAYRDCLDDPADEDRHHEMRIAAKALRYALETCRPAYDGELDEFIAAAKRAQTLLGEVHDCDIWREHVAAFEAQELERTRTYYGHTRSFRRLRPGIEYLRSNRRRRREMAFAELVDFWRQLEDQRTWEAMLQVVTSRAELPAAADGPVPPADAGHAGDDGP